MNTAYAASVAIFLLLSYWFFYSWIKPTFITVERYSSEISHSMVEHVIVSIVCSLMLPALYISLVVPWGILMPGSGNTYYSTAWLDSSTFGAFVFPFALTTLAFRFKEQVKSVKAGVGAWLKPHKPTFQELEEQCLSLQNVLKEMTDA